MTGKENGVMLSVQALHKHFPIRRGFLRREAGALRAVDGVDIDIVEGESFGLVGESGSGKSTLARVMLALDRPGSGRILFRGRDLSTLDAGELRRIRQQMQIIFQDPYASLNPRMRVARIIREPLDIHGIGSPRERDIRVSRLLEMVGLDASHAGRYPHEFSGGQRQRIGIARALATEPSFIVAAEPISALDVSIQAQIVNLLADLRDRLGLTYLFIAHDLAMVRQLCDRVAVMYLGKIVELGCGDDLFGSPLHPYTRALIDSVPLADPSLAGVRRPALLQGELPDPSAPPAGCRFNTRCPFATGLCRSEEPELKIIESAGATRQVACHHVDSLPRYTGVRGASV